MNNRQALETYFESMNVENWEEFKTLWARDAYLKAVGARERQGADEILAFYRGLFAPWSAHTDTPTRVIGDGDTLAVEVVFTGVSRQGESISFDAVDVFDFEDGTITRLTNWYDLNHVRRLLGQR